MALSPSVWQEDSNDNTAISYAGRQFYVNAENPWSFDSKDNSTLRFEVRKGDQYVSSGYTDSSGVERAEMGDVARYSINQDISVEYKFMIEPGAKNTAKWMVMGQLHSAMNMSPPIEIKFNGNDKMKISGNSGSTGNPIYRDIYSDSQDIVRGHWYTMKMNIKFDPYGNGSAQIFRDGVKIVDYHGALGYTNQTQTYWKEGVYRSTASETTAVNYKDLVIKTGAGAFAPTAAMQATAAPASSKAAGSTSTDALFGSNGSDNLSGGAGNDSIYGYAGKDELQGGGGKDFLDGGTSGDRLFGGSSSDVLSGRSGHDRLEGGTGHDVLYGSTGNDVMLGGKGNDRLVGGSGKDILSGGEGSDTFALKGTVSAKSCDTITDFDASSDRVELQSAHFRALSKGQLKSSDFSFGAAASSNDHIVYDGTTGALYYDADGSGAGKAIHIATLKGAPALSSADFFIV